MTNQYALGYKAGLEAAVKVCREKSELFRNTNGECIKAIAALPVPEVQWRDLTDEEIEEAYEVAELGHFASAVIAKFKEKQQ